MRAHFIGSTTDISTDIESFRLIIKALEKKRVALVTDWIEEVYEKEKDKPGQNHFKWQDIYRDNLDAISRADVIVAEVGRKSFLVGFQVANALKLKKPILLLSKSDKVDSALGVSSNEEIIKFSKYTNSNINAVIGKFIDENSSGAKDIRFNFFINRKLLNYLNWAALQTGEKKSEIVRRLIIEDMNNSDYR